MQKLSLQQLEAKLWKCADILRGELSATQYMDYIFGMMFLKRMNDEFEIRKVKTSSYFRNIGLYEIKKI